jgi:hypothetical protein
MHRSVVSLSCVLLGLLACHSAGRDPFAGVGPLVGADAIVEGRAAATATDTIDAKMSIRLLRARWALRTDRDEGRDFWSDVALLDTQNAERAASTMDERTFAVALRTLMEGQPGAAAVAFGLLHAAATDSLVRSRARIGLTMALSYDSDWQAMARLRAIPDQPVVLPMRRSFLGTPVVTIRINGKEHEFWLDTGASMTLLSTDVAIAAGAKLAAEDTLALGVVGGHIEARAIYIDSMAIGPVTVRGLGAALVSPEVLRFDQKLVNGLRTAVPIDGMIGTDVLRHLDVVMDAKAGTITLRRPRRYAGTRRNLFWVGYPVVRLVTPDGRPVLFGLDTGAEGTYVTNTLLKKAPRTPIAMRRMSLVGLGSDSKRTAKSTWIARQVPLSDGNYAIMLNNVPIMPPQRWTFVDFDGVIGSDVALATRMHLDFTNGVFDIRASDAPNVYYDGAPDVKVVY